MADASITCKISRKDSTAALIVHRLLIPQSHPFVSSTRHWRRALGGDPRRVSDHIPDKFGGLGQT